MERIEELVARKREILGDYRKHLENLPGVRMNPEPQGVVNGSWMPTVVFDLKAGVTREQLQAAFAAQKIDARVFFWPLSGLTIFQPVKSNTNAWSIPGRAINLPSYYDITDEDIEHVLATLSMVLR
jgi:perosamine synthetase